MKVLFGLLIVVLGLLTVAAVDTQRAFRATQYPRFQQVFAKTKGTKCQGLHCVYDNAVCCPGLGGRKPTCCPSGYKCSFPDSGPTTCDSADAELAKGFGSKNHITTIRPTIVVNAGAAGLGPAGSAAPQSNSLSASLQQALSSSLASMQQPPAPVQSGFPSGSSARASQSAPAAPPSSSSASSSGSSSDSSSSDSSSSSSAPPVPKFRQNIIIVKNINVLTKLQQVRQDGGSASGSSSGSGFGSGSSSHRMQSVSDSSAESDGSDESGFESGGSESGDSDESGSSMSSGSESEGSEIESGSDMESESGDNDNDSGSESQF